MDKIKSIMLISTLILFLTTLNCYSQDEKDFNSKNEDIIYNLADLDETPNYIGGVDAFYKFIGENFNLPNIKVTEGKIQIELIVEKDGSLSNINVIEDFGHNSGNELVRVLHNSPKWASAKKNKINVRCKINFPVIISVNSEVSKQEEEIYYSYNVNEKAEYPGGFDILESFFRYNFKIPEDFEPEGNIFVKLIVEKDGSLTVSNIRSEIGYGTEQETARIVNILPKWKPAKIGTDFVKSYCELKLNFDNKQRLTILNKKQLNKNYNIPNLASIKVDKKAQYVGGIDKFYKYIFNSFRLPDNQNLRSGTILTTFVIESDGSVTNINVIEDIGFGTGHEITRVLMNCPNWIPGEINGEPVRSQFVLPITFSN